MTKASDNVFSRFLISEGGSTTTPAANRVTVYAKADGLLYSKDDAGVETLVSGGAGGGAVATDAIWDAAGDLAQGTGANTAAKLGAGTAGQFLKSGGAATANAWASRELDYVQITSNASITATTEGTANTVVTATATAFDGSTIVLIEFYSPSSRPDSTAAGAQLSVFLYDDAGGGAASIGMVAFTVSQAANAPNIPLYIARRLTPSNATHTYSIRAAVSSGTGAIGAGAGGSGASMPAFIRITRAV